MNKAILSRWLKAGFLERGVFHGTTEGTPQGGIISPVLANMTLDGLERRLAEHFAPDGRAQRRHKVHLVRYADDFIITGATPELLEQRVRPVLVQFLQERGLELSGEKTHITRIEDGFDFLGQTARRFGSKVLNRPSRRSVTALLEEIRGVVRRSGGATAGQVIVQVNPVIRGWALYHRHGASARTFARVDRVISGSLWRWARRRHRGKPSRWVQEHYFPGVGGRRTFTGTVTGPQGKPATVQLVRASQVSIRRHIKVRGDANPYDPAWEPYYEERQAARIKDTQAGWWLERVLWEAQQGRCRWCHQQLTPETGWQIHHREWRVYGGTDLLENLELLHPNCHRQLHSRFGQGTLAASCEGR